MGKETVYRVEERKHPDKPPLDFINDVLNPLEKVEKIISEFSKGLKKCSRFFLQHPALRQLDAGGTLWRIKCIKLFSYLQSGSRLVSKLRVIYLPLFSLTWLLNKKEE